MGRSEYCSATLAPFAAESAMLGGCRRCVGATWWVRLVERARREIRYVGRGGVKKPATVRKRGTLYAKLVVLSREPWQQPARHNQAIRFVFAVAVLELLLAGTACPDSNLWCRCCGHWLHQEQSHADSTSASTRPLPNTHPRPRKPSEPPTLLPQSL